jgi:hypothetical protein
MAAALLPPPRPAAPRRSARGTRRRPRAARRPTRRWCRRRGRARSVAGMMFSPDSPARRSSSSALRFTASLSRCGAPGLRRRRSSRLDRRVDLEDRSSPAERRRAVSVKRLTPTTVSSPDSMRRIRSAWLRTRRPFSSSMASNAPPSASTSSSSAWAPVDQLGGLGLDHHRALEDVVVLEQVGLVGQDLLHPQRPLLVPRARQAERLVPRRQLDGGPGRRATG